MSGAERRYRRLLALYPRDHREHRGEEMLGVLLEGGEPGWRDYADLVAGALRLHLRRVFALDGGVDPRDVLAVVSLLGPIAVLVGATSALREVAWWVKVGSFWQMPWSEQVPDAPVWAIWAITAVLALCGLRRSAAVGAWVACAAYAWLPTVSPTWPIAINGGIVLLGLFAAAALTWSAGPRRGRELVGGAAVPLFTAAVGVAVSIEVLTSGPRWVAFAELGVLALGAFLACGVRSRVGRRAALVVVVPVLVGLLTWVLMHFIGRIPEVLQVAIPVALPLAVLLVLGALPRGRRRLPGTPSRPGA
ncbi:hypothetical protein [Actinokineospora bangkokensis]|uniref:Uncharacterized protein n=1 Tax=Actinokineospora bangkokensis TaxID=1193682 RepID=A0A1Q9LMV3_9PSEU|nr:hypothetical protein [Actinokineospora bangkokensis]OLR93358.1 hypothetical protein BJP25_17995 [Actinokineospora bangkokensis]